MLIEADPGLRLTLVVKRKEKEVCVDNLWQSYIAAAAKLMVFLTLLAVNPVYATAGLLDGKKFVGETGEKGKSKGDKEEFVFTNGTYDPLACHKYGFSGTPYSTSVEGDAVKFAAEHSNKKGDRMKWEGTVKGNTLEGVMTYWQGKKTPRSYWFKGSLVHQE